MRSAIAHGQEKRETANQIFLRVINFRHRHANNTGGQIASICRQSSGSIGLRRHGRLLVRGFANAASWRKAPAQFLEILLQARTTTRESQRKTRTWAHTRRTPSFSIASQSTAANSFGSGLHAFDWLKRCRKSLSYFSLGRNQRQMLRNRHPETNNKGQKTRTCSKCQAHWPQCLFSLAIGMRQGPTTGPSPLAIDEAYI